MNNSSLKVVIMLHARAKVTSRAKQRWSMIFKRGVMLHLEHSGAAELHNVVHARPAAALRAQQNFLGAQDSIPVMAPLRLLLPCPIYLTAAVNKQYLEDLYQLALVYCCPNKRCVQKHALLPRST